MASDKKTLATEGREQIAGLRYSEIRNIISSSSDVKFKDIIGDIAGISPGSYYNYTSENSPKYGRVSLYTAKNLSEYFKLPLGIFDCSQEFTDEAKLKIANIISSKYKLNSDVKNKSELLSDALMNKLEYASKMEDKEKENIIKESLERYFIYPFMSKNHVINYFYLLNKYNDANRRVRGRQDKTDNLNQDRAFMYCLAYEDVIMEYIRDGEVLTFDNGIKFEWSNELKYYSHDTYPTFIEMVLSKYSRQYYYSVDDYDCVDLADFEYSEDENEVLVKARAVYRDSSTIKNIEWYKNLLEIKENGFNEISTKKYSKNDFLNSDMFNQFESNNKKMMLLMFEKLTNKGVDFYIEAKLNNILTIYASENVGNKLAIIGVYKNEIRTTVIYEDYYDSYYNIEMIDDYWIDKIVARYNNPPKYKNAKYDWNNEVFIYDEK